MMRQTPYRRLGRTSVIELLVAGSPIPVGSPFDCPRTALTFPMPIATISVQNIAYRAGHIAHSAKLRQYFLVISETTPLGPRAMSSGPMQYNTPPQKTKHRVSNFIHKRNRIALSIMISTMIAPIAAADTPFSKSVVRLVPVIVTFMSATHFVSRSPLAPRKAVANVVPTLTTSVIKVFQLPIRAAATPNFRKVTPSCRTDPPERNGSYTPRSSVIARME